MSYKTATNPPGQGQPTEKIACPFCGWIRPLKYGISQRTGEPREVRFDRMDLDTAPIWRLEKLSGAGRASKNAKIELLETRTLREIAPELKEQIRQQCHKILEILKEE